MQDLRLINAAVIPAHPLVPNPYTLLSSIPPQTSHFTIIDLKDAFFTIPLHPDCQFLFAFTWTDPDTQLTTQLTWTVLPQGFRDSPHYFGQALSRDLARCSLRPSTLLQCVDDLLLCSPSEETSRQHTATLLNFLGSQGYRASQSKAQLTQTSAVYLGLQITPTTKALTADWFSLLRSICPPADGDQILSFLGLTGFFRHWVPNYATLAKPLYSATKETPTGPLSSPTEVTQAFHALRSTLLAAPPLFLPNPNYPHHLYSDEKGGIAFGALVQPIGPELLPIAYISKQLDPTARGWFPCLRALAAATTLYADAKKLIHGQPLTIFSPHHLGDLLASRFLSELSESRLQQFHLIFLDNPQVSVGRSPQLNLLSSLPHSLSPQSPQPTHARRSLSPLCNHPTTCSPNLYQIQS